MRIQVTADDIQSGERCNPWKCPVARAIARKTSARYVCAKERTIIVQARQFRVAETPAKVKEFIIAFDSKKPVKPFSFELELP